MQPLSTHTRPIFRRGLSLSSSCPASADDLRRELTKQLSDFDERARRDGHSSAVVEEARYALCAWLDEMVFSSTPFSIDWLGHSLAVAHFQDQAAGNNFFSRMERLHQRADLASSLEIYARCILLGFKGQYQLEDPSRLQGVVADVQRKAADSSWRSAPWFSALVHEPGKRGKERTGRFLVWIGLGALILSFAIYTILSWLARNS
ncbi:MAG: DotU family type IV/VI secretion system protein [Fibrobacteres bacterium]|jgi:type IV/VI secretion system ImpK/VasF family protein|nr:DotU family type IV/VI secretion system protein [Fibrobacterota bacterium]